MKKHIIDLDKDPLIPHDGWTVEEHQKGGKLAWDAEKIELYLHPKQKEGYIEGNDLRKEVPNPLNANVLDFLLENPKLIPEEWKGKYIFFWGTIYRDSVGSLYVRYLYFHGGHWPASHRWLDDDWYGDYPLAVLASPSPSEPQTSSEPLNLEKRVEALEEQVSNIRKFLIF